MITFYLFPVKSKLSDEKILVRKFEALDTRQAYDIKMTMNDWFTDQDNYSTSEQNHFRLCPEKNLKDYKSLDIIDINDFVKSKDFVYHMNNLIGNNK